jgi:hypothetical protein
MCVDRSGCSPAGRAAVPSQSFWLTGSETSCCLVWCRRVCDQAVASIYTRLNWLAGPPPTTSSPKRGRQAWPSTRWLRQRSLRSQTGSDIQLAGIVARLEPTLTRARLTCPVPGGSGRVGPIELKKASMFWAKLVAPCGRTGGFGVQPLTQVGCHSPLYNACGWHRRSSSGEIHEPWPTGARREIS